MDILKYMSGRGRRSILHGVPMHHLDTVKSLFAKKDYKIKIRYRGPRAHRYTNDFLNNINAKSNCLKADATSFAVYVR